MLPHSKTWCGPDDCSYSVVILETLDSASYFETGSLQKCGFFFPEKIY